MEKRALIRDHVKLSVSCSRLTTSSPISQCDGVMLNCSCGGTCIEMNEQIHKGSILIIKAAGCSDKEFFLEPLNGLRTVAVAEVKWSKPANSENDLNYRIGLKYLPD